MLRRAVAGLMAVSALSAVSGRPVAGQSLTDLVSELFVFGQCGVPLCLDSDFEETGNYRTEHGRHYLRELVPLNDAILLSFHEGIGGVVGSLPATAMTGGAIWSNDDRSASLGPIFAERAETLGMGRFFLGLDATALRVTNFSGVPADNLVLNFFHEDSHVALGPTPGLGLPRLRARRAAGEHESGPRLHRRQRGAERRPDVLSRRGVRRAGRARQPESDRGRPDPVARRFACPPLRRNGRLPGPPGEQHRARVRDGDRRRLRPREGQPHGRYDGGSGAAARRHGAAGGRHLPHGTGGGSSRAGRGPRPGAGHPLREPGKLSLLISMRGICCGRGNLRDRNFDRDAVLATVGFDARASAAGTVAVDLITRWELADSEFPMPGPVTFAGSPALTVEPSSIPDADRHFIDLAVGLKYMLGKDMILRHERPAPGPGRRFEARPAVDAGAAGHVQIAVASR